MTQILEKEGSVSVPSRIMATVTNPADIRECCIVSFIRDVNDYTYHLDPSEPVMQEGLLFWNLDKISGSMDVNWVAIVNPESKISPITVGMTEGEVTNRLKMVEEYYNLVSKELIEAYKLGADKLFTEVVGFGKTKADKLLWELQEGSISNASQVAWKRAVKRRVDVLDQSKVEKGSDPLDTESPAPDAPYKPEQKANNAQPYHANQFKPKSKAKK